jgi:hypothetical protein
MRWIALDICANDVGIDNDCGVGTGRRHWSAPARSLHCPLRQRQCLRLAQAAVAACVLHQRPRVLALLTHPTLASKLN